MEYVSKYFRYSTILSNPMCKRAIYTVDEIKNGRMSLFLPKLLIDSEAQKVLLGKFAKKCLAADLRDYNQHHFARKCFH